MYIAAPVDYLIMTLLVTVMFAIWNGLINKQLYQDDTFEKQQATSKVWHTVGWIIRACLAIIVFLATSWVGLWVYIIFAWHLYDIIINLVRGLKWNHLGQNFIDKSKWNKVVKIIILLSGLLFLL